MEQKIYRFLVIGAHPDDCELTSGGLGIKCRQRGDTVKFLSVTNGNTGHFQKCGEELAAIRTKEAAAAAALFGIESEVLDIGCNRLEADIPTRERIIRIIRGFNPDVIITHRLNDYHPDHRRTSMLVQDSSYAMRVPFVCPDVPAMKHTPLILHPYDSFRKPVPFSPDVVIEIDSVLEQKLDMAHCHASQMYEWLPWMDGILEDVPTSDTERREWLREYRFPKYRDIAAAYRVRLRAFYGNAKGSGITYAEAFEVSEYGEKYSKEKHEKYFPW